MEWQGGAMLAQAGLPPKAMETNMDKATIALARTPTRPLHLLMLEEGDMGRRLALAGRLLVTCCVLADKQDGQGGHLLGGRRQA